MSKVSFVLSVFNGADTLVDALESTLTQTVEDFELVTVDDGSTDNSLDILNYYAERDSRVIVLANSHNIGVANSSNRGIERATGEYIARLDQDDINISTRIEKQITVLDKNPEVGVVSSYVDMLYAKEVSEIMRRGMDIFEGRRRILTQEQQNLNRAVVEHNIFHNGETMFRKQLWEKIGGYRPYLTMADDYDLWLRLTAHTGFYIIPEVLYIRRFGKTNLTVTHMNMMHFISALARECYELRQTDQDDTEYARSQFISFLSQHDLMEQYAHYLTH